MSKKLLALLCVLTLVLSLGTAAFASPEAPEGGFPPLPDGATSQANVEAPEDRPDPEVIEGERYVTDYLPGASAVYVSGVEKTFDDAYFYGIGYSTDQEITDEVSSQYGHGAVVLAAGQGTDLTLNNPTIIGDPQGRSNGVFASAMAKVTVNGGTIDTNCAFGAHGLDVTYMGHIYAYDTVIHTTGSASGAIASDFGGGFVYGEGIDCTTDGDGSPAIFAAGSSIFMMKDSSFTVNNGNGIVLSVYKTVVMLDNCTLTSSADCLSGMMNMGATVGDKADIFHSTLESQSGAVISEMGGITEINMVDTTAIPGGDTVINCSMGTLTVNLWDTELTGNVTCSSGTLTINLYSGGKLTGEVSGSGNVSINVYEGGEYVGSFAATEQSGSGEPAPEPGTFDEYLESFWAYGTLLWNEETVENYVTNVEPEIIENSAGVYKEDGAVEKVYDPETVDLSENGMDASLVQSADAPGPTAGRAATEAASAEAAAEASEDASAESAGGYTADEAGYQQYLKDYVKAVPANDDEALAVFEVLIDAGDYSTFPMDMCFMDTFWGYTAATLDEFLAAGGAVEIPAFDPNLTKD